ncbi:hypothetical protein HKX48_008092 [Thoreauomyces humboldtii]|nr:hypothetical protein HKX48_008092 [Thoreauomyces humboldtii]
MSPPYVATAALSPPSAHPGLPADADHTELCIGGLYLHVHGLKALAALPVSAPLHVIFFLHGRLQSAISSLPITHRLSTALLAAATTKGDAVATVVVSFDQRNHGTRLLQPVQNESWGKGNPNHAWDMYALQQGTACDASFLIDHLPGYLGRDVTSWGVFGVSLGGHATLLALANEPRLRVGVSIIGCGDYLTLMTQRAAKADMGVPPDSDECINGQLVRLVEARDPVNRADAFKDKKVLMLNGGADKLVPVRCSDHFVRKVQEGLGREGVFEVVVEDGVKHEVTEEMQKRTAEWFGKYLLKSVESIDRSSTL